VRRSGTPVAGLVGGQVRVEWWARRGVAVGLDGLLGVAMIDVRDPWFVPDFTIGAQAGYRLRTDGARGVHLGGRLAKDVGPCISKNCAYEPLGTAARLDLGVVLDEDRFLEVAAGAAVVVTR
jgi:hypothetical protein